MLYLFGLENKTVKRRQMPKPRKWDLAQGTTLSSYFDRVAIRNEGPVNSDKVFLEPGRDLMALEFIKLREEISAVHKDIKGLDTFFSR